MPSRWPALLVGFAACFHPSPPEGAPCAEDDHCPEPLHCFDGACRSMRLPDAPIDAVSAIGCADGQREAFVDPMMHARIAGCAATWAGALDMRAPRTGAACGDDLGPCAAPVDACATGWHVCADTGRIGELLVVTGLECMTEPGAFIAASGHCTSSAPCTYIEPFACPTGSVACSQPICCGDTCDRTNGCENGVWPAATAETKTAGPGCGNTPGDGQDGVLCCRDP